MTLKRIYGPYTILRLWQDTVYGHNRKVDLVLKVGQGPKYPDLPKPRNYGMFLKPCMYGFSNHESMNIPQLTGLGISG